MKAYRGLKPGNILLPDGVTMDAVADGERSCVDIRQAGFEGMTYDEAMVMAEDAERLFSQMGDLRTPPPCPRRWAAASDPREAAKAKTKAANIGR